MSLAAGTRLGPYEITAQIGAGGMGEVYKARDTRLDRSVAIKVLPAALATDAAFRDRFDREARAISALDHPHICTLYDVGQQDATAFLVMQYLEGETLLERLTKGALPHDEALKAAIEIASALDQAHRAGVIHRDLKPGNVMLTKTGAKLLDFGVAKATTSVDDDVPTRLTELTSPGMIVGTIQYMAPEQIEGKRTDARSDIFAFGAVLFEMLCGEKAFAVDARATLASHAPPALALVVHTCLERRPDERWQTTDDLLRQLQRIKEAGASAPKPKRVSKSVDSLAVLPFANASQDPDAEYLSEGITESLINAFSQLPHLRVIPRTSAFRFQDRQAAPVAVGRELNVRAVLTGKVLQRGDTLVVQAELLDVSKDAQIWGGQYNRKRADVFAVQEDISAEILERLRVRLTAEDKRRLTKRPTTTPAVYELYLKGRYHWARRTAEGIQKSIEYFQRAIAADPHYALAYTGVADAYILLNYYGMPSKLAAPQAKAAAKKALAIDPKLAEAHTSLAFATYLYDWDFPQAERGFKHAFDINSEYWEAHDWYALSLAGVGRFEEAIAEMERAIELDPLSLVLHHHAAWIFILAREYDRSIELCRTALEMEPNFGLSYYWMGKALAQKGCCDEAFTALKKSLTLLPESLCGGALGYAYAVCGRRADAEDYLLHLESLSADQYVEPYNLAAIHAGLGNTERALEWLQRATDDRSIHLASFVAGDPWFDSLRADARFEQFARPFRDRG